MNESDVEHGAIDLREARPSGHRHRRLELAAQVIEHCLDGAAAARGERVRPRAPEQHRVRAEREHPKHVEAGTDAAVDADRELPAVRAERDGLPRVLGVEDALDQKRTLPLRTDPVEILPCDRRVEVTPHPADVILEAAVLAEDGKQVAERMRTAAQTDVISPARLA